MRAGQGSYFERDNLCVGLFELTFNFYQHDRKGSYMPYYNSMAPLNFPDPLLKIIIPEDKDRTARS